MEPKTNRKMKRPTQSQIVTESTRFSHFSSHPSCHGMRQMATGCRPRATRRGFSRAFPRPSFNLIIFFVSSARASCGQQRQSATPVCRDLLRGRFPGRFSGRFSVREGLRSHRTLERVPSSTTSAWLAFYLHHYHSFVISSLLLSSFLSLSLVLRSSGRIKRRPGSISSVNNIRRYSTTLLGSVSILALLCGFVSAFAAGSFGIRGIRSKKKTQRPR